MADLRAPIVSWETFTCLETMFPIPEHHLYWISLNFRRLLMRVDRMINHCHPQVLCRLQAASRMVRILKIYMDFCKRTNCIPIVGMVKQPTNEQTEFTMSSEDFPALPGTQISEGSSNNALSTCVDGIEKMSSMGAGMSMGMDLQADNNAPSEKALKRGVQTSPDGKIFF